jgi:hypothetical protein
VGFVGFVKLIIFKLFSEGLGFWRSRPEEKRGREGEDKWGGRTPLGRLQM